MHLLEAYISVFRFKQPRFQPHTLTLSHRRLAMERKQLFDFMVGRVKETGRQSGLKDYQAFGKWFLEMYFLNPQNTFVSDGSRDGKVDIFFTTHNDKVVDHHILNTKYTEQYDKTAPA